MMRISCFWQAEHDASRLEVWNVYQDLYSEIQIKYHGAPNHWQQNYLLKSLVSLTSKPHHWPSVRGIQFRPLNSSNKGPIKQKELSCPFVTMINCHGQYRIRADSRFAPSQWEMSLQSNVVSHWLSTNLESTNPLYVIFQRLFYWGI